MDRVTAASEATGSTSVPPTRGAWRFLASAVILSGVLSAGLLGGWMAARQKSSGAAAHGGHGGEAEPSVHGSGLTLSARALANLGVEVGPIALSDYVRTLDVPAQVEVLPLTDRTVTSPVAGTVRELRVVPGESVASGAVLATLVRDPFPPPTLGITEAVLRPLNEEYHQASAHIGSAALALSLARSELARLAPSAPDAPERVTGRVLRDAQYEVQRAEQVLANAREEGQRHGLTPDQVAQLETGNEKAVPDLPDVRRVLLRNRLWNAQADSVLALLPEQVRGLPHTLAVLGELVGTGRLTEELARVMAAEPGLGSVFLDVAGLIQTGVTPTALSDLATRGAFDPIVTLRAPTDLAPSWDVLDVDVRVGTHIAAGLPLAHLRDDRTMALRLTPAPSDLGALALALKAGASLRAEPLVRGAGEVLDGVELIALTGSSGMHGPGAFARVANQLLHASTPTGQGTRQSWQLRPGMTYAVKVPVERRPGRFVLPADAIAFQGSEAVVLLPDGKGFRTVPVRLERHDAQVAVVAADGALFPGDQVVLRGAPALAMALLAGAGGGADPHAGHNH